jgi:hypothetical protein
MAANRNDVMDVVAAIERATGDEFQYQGRMYKMPAPAAPTAKQVKKGS